MLRKLRDLASDSATYGLSGVIRQAISFFLLPLYTSYLTPEDYGILALLAIVALLFLPLANLGISNAVFRRYNTVKNEEERLQVLNTGMISVVAFSVALTLLGFAIAGPLAFALFGKQVHIQLVELTLIGACFDSIAQIPQVTLRADRRVKLAAGLNVISLLANVLMTIALVVGLEKGVQGVVWANTAGSLFSMVLQFLFVLKTVRLIFDRVLWRAMLTYGLPFLPHRLLSLGLTQFGVYMISHMLGTEEAGLYSIAMRVILPIQMIVDSIQRAWVPFKFQIHADEAEPEPFFRSITTYYVALTTYLWLGVALWGPEVVRLMTTSDFHAAAPLVPFVALIPFVRGLYFMFGTGIELSDNTKPLPVVSFFGFMAVVIGAFALIPLIDAYGAALATVAGWMAMTIVIYIISQRRIQIPYDWTSVFQLVATSQAIVLVGLVLSEHTVMIRLAFAVLASIGYPVIGYAILSRSATESQRFLMLQASLNNRFRGLAASLSRGRRNGIS